jgi:hypothetical protein
VQRLPIGLRDVGELVVPARVVRQALPKLGLGGAGEQAEERVGKVTAVVVQLLGKVVGLGLPELAHQRCVLVAVVDVVGQGSLVVEELAVHRPSRVLAPDPLPDDLTLELLDGLAEEELLLARTVAQNDRAQPLVLRGEGTVVRGRGGGEPALVDAAPLSAEGVVVVGVELDAPAGHAEGARHPGRRQAKDAFALFQGTFGQ